MKKLNIRLFILTGIFAFLCHETAYGCTVWGSLGAGVTEQEATLVIKVRDEKPSKHCLKTVRDGRGYAFRGVFVGKNERFNTGVNEKGLFVGLTTAGSVPLEVRKKYRFLRSPEGWMPNEFLIRRCATVEEALAHREIFNSGHAVNYLIADRTSVAIVECLPAEGFSVKRIENGTLTHTNHYVDWNTIGHNERISQSSFARYRRINELLGNAKRPYRMGDFITMSKDQSEGPDLSIFRSGSKPAETRTLCVIGARIPKIGHPELYVRYKTNPNDSAEAWKEIFEAFH